MPAQLRDYCRIYTMAADLDKSDRAKRVSEFRNKVIVTFSKINKRYLLVLRTLHRRRILISLDLGN